MADDPDLDYNFVDDDNRSDLYFYAYDHPFWRKYELDLNTLFLSRNTTLAPKRDILELSKLKCLVFSPLFIIVSCVLISGAFCNITVCYIYRCRSRRAASNFFVIFFAVFDLFGSLVGIPLEVASLMYSVNPLCMVTGCVKSWLVCCQCLTLLCVAVDCYEKICHPEREFNVRRAKVCCVVTVVLAGMLSLPALAVFSTKPVETQYTDLCGVGCSLDSNVVEWLRILYYVCVLGTFIVSLCAMAGLYGLIFMTWHKQRQADETGRKASPVKRDFPKRHRFVRQDTSTSCMTQYSEEIYRLHDIHRSLHCAFIPHSDQVQRIRCKRQSKIGNKSNGEMKTIFLSSNGIKTNSKTSSAAMSGKKSNNVHKPSNQRNSESKSVNRNNSGGKRNGQSNSGNKPSSLNNSGSKQNYLSSSGIKTGNQISGGHTPNHQNHTSGNTHTCSSRIGMSSIQLYIKNNGYVLMFTVISVLTTVNMLPFVVVTILGATTSMFTSFTSNTREMLFHFCSCSYLLNYLVKPLTYMFLNANFRKEMQQIFTNLKYF